MVGLTFEERLENARESVYFINADALIELLASLEDDALTLKAQIQAIKESIGERNGRYDS